MKARKMLIFNLAYEKFLQDSMRLAECQINRIGVNFQLLKSLEIYYKNSADKLWSKRTRFEKDKGWKVPSPIPIRVKIALLCRVLKE